MSWTLTELIVVNEDGSHSLPQGFDEPSKFKKKYIKKKDVEALIKYVDEHPESVVFRKNFDKKYPRWTPDEPLTTYTTSEIFEHKRELVTSFMNDEDLESYNNVIRFFNPL